MIKSDVKITETAINAPQVNLRANLNANFSPAEAKNENLLVEKVNERLHARTHFARLKRRLRCRPTSIF